MVEVQDAILSGCHPDWRKVARVISVARDRLSLPDSDASYDLLEKQLIKLVEAGKLDAVGDLSDWRQSEVRLAAI